MPSAPAAPPPQTTKKKPLVRRREVDRSQVLRRWFQVAFLALNVWIGIEFLLFVRFHESGGSTVWVQRPPGVEGWLPIASLMNLKAWVVSGEIPPLHPAGMFILTAFLAISLVFRKTFCSWLCPVGTISEWLWKLGRETFGRNFALPRWFDIPLRGIKYLIFGLFAYAIAMMPVVAIRAFLDGPYGVVADVKMLNFFRHMTVTTAVTVGVLILLSVFIKNFWCRYLCPYGAMLGVVALFSPVRIRRQPDACIDCGKCSKECPQLLPVDKLVQIRSAECTACMQCVSVCPTQGALHLGLPRRRKLPAWGVAVGITVIFLGIYGWAQWNGYWKANIPSEVYFDLIPRAHEFRHP
jgi:polyferredoxin